jgi:3-oxoacyl-(acyl-carrier-protein) synthase
MSIVTGAASVLLPRGEEALVDPLVDPLPFLKVRKSRKYMGLQDDLAVVATGRALENAGLKAPLGPRTGLYLAVGYIPFRQEDIEPVLEASLSDDRQRFDVKRFGAGGYQRAHPLLTFRCLPNMPAYHVSVCFGIEGPYAVTYPGPAQLYGVLEEARAALAEDRIDIAIVGAVAHQSNFLVEHHYGRIDPPVAADQLRDVAGVIVLEQEVHARARGAVIRAKIETVRVEYDPFDILDEGRASIEKINGQSPTHGELGPALLPDVIARAVGSGPGCPTTITHTLESRDGIRAESQWVIA